MRRFTWVVAVAVLVAVAAPLHGSTFLHMNRQELATKASAVVVGRVLGTSSFWEETGRIIVTEAMVAVDEVLLGDAPTVAVVRTFGGTVDGFTVEAHGFPTFAAGDHLLLYLENDRVVKGGHRVLGYREGQYRVIRDQGGKLMAVPMVDGGARLLTADGRQAPAPRALPLDQLRAEIRDVGRRVGRPVF
jgi:hypothetical protein